MTFFNRLHFLRACFYSNLTKLLRNEHRDKQGETPRFEQDEHAEELFCMPTSLPGLPPALSSPVLWREAGSPRQSLDSLQPGSLATDLNS